MGKLGDPRVDGVLQYGQLMAGATAVPMSPVGLRRMKSLKHPCSVRLVGGRVMLGIGKCWLDKCSLDMALRVGGEPEREVCMCAREGLEEEVRVLLGRGRREAVAHLVELAFELLLIHSAGPEVFLDGRGSGATAQGARRLLGPKCSHECFMNAS